jgi:4-hydroxy-2-oxoheptanedioate aldolase
MKWIRQKVLGGEILTGTFLNLGSGLTVEIAGRSGLDWLLIDTEHGAGDYTELVHQLQAAEGTPAAPIVRSTAVQACTRPGTLRSHGAVCQQC